MKICVIGAGAAGLSAIKHSIDFNCEVTAFEQSDELGGTWVKVNDAGTNKYGLEVHSSLYDNLVTNLPIELMCYPNEPFPENEQSFVSSDDVFRYYQAYADKYNLRDYIKFEHHVLQVRPLFDNSWEVIVKNLPKGSIDTYVFDGILVCNGHYFSGRIPNYEGRELFRGKQMHSHDYRNPETVKGEEILVIGGNFSAVDIVQQTSPFAKSVTWSHHLKHKPDGKAFGGNVNQKPDVKRMNESGVEFVDGSVMKFSTIFYCTGYEYKFPFLSIDCGINTNEDYVKPLFKHCLNIVKPTMGFIGVPNLICPNQMFCLQARFCLKFITKQKELPTFEVMMKDYESEMETRRKRGEPKKKAHVMGPDVQEVYYADLAATAEIDPLKPVIARMHKFTNLNRERDFINFRKNKYTIIDDETFEIKQI